MNDVIHDEDFPADGGWPGARSFINLAELSGLTPAPAGAQVPRRRPIPDRPSRAGVAAINMAAVRAVVDEKRRAMSPAEWAKATKDGAMVARGLRVLARLPDPQRAMPAFRRKMAKVGVTESAIASIPPTWDARLADVLIAAHGEMGKLPGPPNREPQMRGTHDSAGLFGAPRHTQDSADEDWPDWMRERYGDPAEWRERRIEIEDGEGEKHVRVSDAERHRRDWERYVFALGEKEASSGLTKEEAEILRRERGEETLLGGSGLDILAQGDERSNFDDERDQWERNIDRDAFRYDVSDNGNEAGSDEGGLIGQAEANVLGTNEAQSGSEIRWWREDVKLDAQGNPEPTPPRQPIRRHFTPITQPEVDLPADLRTRLDEREIPKDWRDAIARKEVKSEPHEGYGTSATEVKVEQDRTTVTVALGRYQMTRTALRDIGMLDEDQQWTGKYGVHNKREFLTNSDAQEAALIDLTAKYEGYLEDNGHSFDDHRGQVITGLLGDIRITRPGLVAAAHGQGAQAVSVYLDVLKSKNWYSRRALPSDPNEAKKIPSHRDSFAPVPGRALPVSESAETSNNHS